jgi:hypothetical protein
MLALYAYGANSLRAGEPRVLLASKWNGILVELIDRITQGFPHDEIPIKNQILWDIEYLKIFSETAESNSLKYFLSR